MLKQGVSFINVFIYTVRSGFQRFSTVFTKVLYMQISITSNGLTTDVIILKVVLQIFPTAIDMQALNAYVHGQQKQQTK